MSDVVNDNSAVKQSCASHAKSSQQPSPEQKTSPKCEASQEQTAAATCDSRTILSRRSFLAGALGGLGLLGLSLAFGDKVLLGQQLNQTSDTSRLYDYVVSPTKFDAVEWTLANMSEDGILSLGSSEFYISKNLVAQCPQTVFGESCCGVDLTYIGEGYDQSLWQAIAAGAYASKVQRRICTLFVSPQWFFQNPDASNRFKDRFSYELYRAFCQNSDIPDAQRAYVHKRAVKLGVDEKLLFAAERATPIDALNDVGEHKVCTVELRSKLASLIQGAPLKSDVRRQGGATAEPDWQALLAAADQDGASSCTTNNLGIYDEFWNRYHTFTPEQNQTFDDADSEYEDFSCALDVLNSCNIEPLVIMQPLHGPWYDHMNVPSNVRSVWYKKIRKICDHHHVAYANYQPCEYERYFLCDTVHPGWRGWVRIEQSIWNFAHQKNDDFIGGWHQGQSRGQGTDTMRDISIEGL